MKTIFLAFAIAALGFAQTRLSPQQQAQQLQAQTDALASTPIQPAQALSIPINSDLATALEKWRRSVTVAITDNQTGITTTAPQYATLSDMVSAALMGDGGIFARLVADPRFMPESIKVANKASDDAAAAAKAARIAALSGVNSAAPADPPEQ